jgi:hypothetical protein
LTGLDGVILDTFWTLVLQRENEKSVEPKNGFETHGFFAPKSSETIKHD